jgi:hypothetical protein
VGVDESMSKAASKSTWPVNDHDHVKVNVNAHVNVARG